jgi:hypothetical protein
MQHQTDTEYNDAWHGGEENKPVENAVAAAAQEDADRQAREFADAFRNDKFDVEQPADGEQTAGLGDMIKKGAGALGEALLGKGTGRDATGEGQDYKRHVKESEAEGVKPMTPEEFHKSRMAPVKA